MQHTICHVRVTPIAFRDPPLLNAAGIHEPWALRSIIEIETNTAYVGINETYGDQAMLDVLAKAAPALQGLSPWALNEMEARVRALVQPAAGGSEFLGEQISLAPGTHVSKNVAKVISAFEVAMLDLCKGSWPKPRWLICSVARCAMQCLSVLTCSSSTRSTLTSPTALTPLARA